MKTKQTSNITSAGEAPVFLKAGAIAKRFGLCAKTILRWEKIGYVKGRRTSRRTVLFNVSEVTAYVDSCKS